MSLPEFMAALATADPDAFCNPPGMGRGWKVKDIRSGLGRRVLVECDGIIAFARNPRHGCCEACARLRGSECQHCQCSTCVWQREVDGKGSSRVTRAQMAVLIARLKTFQIGRKPVVSLDD
jgi:hypothetical protein